nr:hypothetical protein [Candidatus Levybacteria bacterium]
MDNSGNTTGENQPSQTAMAQQKDMSSEQINRLREKIEKVELPTDLRQTLLERVERLELIRSSAGFLSPNYIVEYDSANSYITWAVGLPWNTVSQDKLDLNAAKEILNKNHYGLNSVKERILDFMAAI